MALYENKVTLKGFLGKDAENFTTKSQRTGVNLSLATKSGHKDNHTQEWVNRTEWHHIVAYSTPAEYAKNLKKGDYVEIEGELHSQPRDLEVVKDEKKGKIQIRNWEVRAKTVRKLAPPSKREENLDAEPITEDDAA